MDISHHSSFIPRLLCPTRLRPSTAYGMKQNIFEHVRFEKKFASLSGNEMLVYETEYHRFSENKHRPERLIGKVVQSFHYDDELNKTIFVYKHIGDGNFALIYRIEDYEEDLKSNILVPNFMARHCRKEFDIVDTVNRMGGSAVFETTMDHRRQDNVTMNLQNGQVLKRSPGFMKSLIGKSQEYHIRFPSIVKDRHIDATNVKTLIIAGVMMVDLCWYDKQCCLPGIPL
jgi:hypothetical protein